MGGLENLWPLAIAANIWDTIVTAPQWIPAGFECSYQHIVADGYAIGEVVKGAVTSIVH